MEIKCIMCKEVKTVQAKPEDIQKWHDGELIQRAMPYLNSYDREFLLTRICAPCYIKMFGDDE